MGHKYSTHVHMYTVYLGTILALRTASIYVNVTKCNMYLCTVHIERTIRTENCVYLRSQLIETVDNV